EVALPLPPDGVGAEAEPPRHHLVARLERLLRLDAERVRPRNGDEDRHHADVDQVAAVAPPVLPDQPPERARRALVEHRLPGAHATPELLPDGAEDEDAEREGRERVPERDA